MQEAPPQVQPAPATLPQPAQAQQPPQTAPAAAQARQTAPPPAPQQQQPAPLVPAQAQPPVQTQRQQPATPQAKQPVQPQPQQPAAAQALPPKPTFDVLASACGPDALKRPTAIVVDRQGNLFVSDTDNNRIVKLTPSGVCLDQWAAEKPTRFALDTQGTVAYLSDMAENRVRRLN